MDYIRDSQIAISHATRWKLARIVAATQPTGLDARQTVDGLAEDILQQWITVNHPALKELWQEREAINDKAIKAVKAISRDAEQTHTKL